MRGFEDITSEIDERSTERMHFRAKPRIKATIQRAAALSGVDDSVFTMNAAYKAALETIGQHERTQLASDDYQAFFDALDNPPAPTEKLRAALTRHKADVTSR